MSSVVIHIERTVMKMKDILKELGNEIANIYGIVL